MKHILMVDDVATNLVLAEEVLRKDYKISTAKSGKQALLLLNEITPDLIMLDINMPGMNGFEVFETIQKNPMWADIPVIFLTAEYDNAKELNGLSMGAMDFLHKPFEPQIMKARIDKILSMQDEKKELRGAANKDALTNLSTRKTLENRIESLDNDALGAFMILDLDNFKKVNDNYGHIVGDSVLVRLARVFEEIISDKDIVCRLGGDEFAIYLEGEDDREAVRGIARRLIATSEFEISDLLSDYSDYHVSVSIGITMRPGDGTDFMTLYANADKALYFVKQNGKRGYHFYDSMNNSRDEFEEENNKINLLQLQRLISEHDENEGAYKVSYDGFKKIYRFVARYIDRKSQEVQIVLFSLDVEGKVLDEENDYINSLGDAVANHLRKGDVATKCGSCQYVVILMDASLENGRKVAERIRAMFLESMNDPSITLDYEIETVKSGAMLEAL